MKSEIKALVFDMDGLLVDSESVYEESWRQAAQKLSLQNIDSIHRQVLGLSREDTILKLKDFYGCGFDGDYFWNLTSQLASEYQKENGVPVKPFIKDCLSYLKNEGYLLALASSSARPVVEEELLPVGLLDFFTVSVCGDEVVKSKPEPEIYLRACEKAGVKPEYAAAVEDSPNGIESAWRAGLKCIMIPDRIQPDELCKSRLWHLFSSAKEIMKIL